MAEKLRMPRCAKCRKVVDRFECDRTKEDKFLWTLYCHGQVELYLVPGHMTVAELESAMELVFLRPSVMFEDLT